VHLFNISSFVMSAAITHALYGAVMQSGAGDVQQIAAMLIGIVAFTLVNHTHVAGVVWFSDKVPPRKTGFFSATSLLADISLLAIGALSALIMPVNAWAIVLAIAPLFLSHSAMRIPLLQQQAETDAKTGLYNSKIFMARATLEFERAQRLDRPLSLVMIDLDLLRDINNAHGHLAGDAAIRAVAQVLRKHARADDIVARFGGEEFALLMVETGEGDSSIRSEAVRADIAAAMPTNGDGTPLRVTASIGVAVRKLGDADLDALIKRADAAMYEAKRQGRNCVRCAAPA
jgi:diguanylate cyclase (GGDEF)-like protein